jgi:hypothetical protein
VTPRGRPAVALATVDDDVRDRVTAGSDLPDREGR